MLNKRAFLKTLKEDPALNVKSLFFILVVIFIPQLLVSYNLMEQSVMPDLHSRITGSRLLVNGQSPYFFHWRQGEDARLYDPNISMPYNLNGVTATPMFLWIQLPLAKLNYCKIKLVWWAIEELLLFTTLFLTCAIPNKRRQQFLTIILGSIFFCYSRNWWQHIYSGQYYILFGFLFAVISYLHNKGQRWPLLIFTIASLIRPFFLLASAPWIFKCCKNYLKWVLVGGFITCMLLLISGSYKVIPEYFKAMKVYSFEVTGWPNYNIESVTSNEPKHLEDCVYKIITPKTFNAGCLFSLQHYLKLFDIIINKPFIFSIMLIFFLVIFILVTGIERITANPDTIILTSFLVYIICELFTPANRNPYNLIQYLGILGILIKRAPALSIILLIFGLALNHDIPFRFPYQREVGEALMLVSIYIAVVNNKEKEALHEVR